MKRSTVHAEKTSVFLKFKSKGEKNNVYERRLPACYAATPTVAYVTERYVMILVQKSCKDACGGKLLSPPLAEGVVRRRALSVTQCVGI